MGKEANGEEAQDGGQDTQSCAFSTWFWSLSQHGGYCLVSPMMPIIKDRAKPINQSIFDKTLSSFINICISNYKVSTFSHFHRLTIHKLMEIFCYALNFA